MSGNLQTLTNAFTFQTAARMIRAFCDGTVRIVHANRGRVRSFNGDGLLAIFRDPKHRDDAMEAALQCVWFVSEVLRPKFERYFSRNEAAKRQALSFRIGCGIDAGQLFAVRVGIGGTNDIAWVGRATNTAAKLGGFADYPNSIIATDEVYRSLGLGNRFSGGASMWHAAEQLMIGGEARTIRRSSYFRSIT